MASAPISLRLKLLAVAGLVFLASHLPGSEGRDAADRLARFALLTETQQNQFFLDLKFELAGLDDPFLGAIRLLAQQAGQPARPRIDRFPPKSKSRSGKADFQLPLPITREYVFGVGIIVPVNGLYSPEELGGGRRPAVVQPRAFPKAQAASRRQAALSALLAGHPPDLDLALAALLQRLDRDSGADRFFAFLESWRNNQESFYQALDRTAGTPESVFFYDAMLDDFVVNFLPKNEPKYEHIRRSLVSAHDALHDAFLAYRQYRGFREAVAFSLVLPPDVPLPATLARYEAKPSYGYCLRDQVAMLLALYKQNPGEVTALIVKTAEPLPDPLWSKPYDPFIAWTREFQSRLSALVALQGDTQRLLARQREECLEVSRKVAATTLKVLARYNIE